MILMRETSAACSARAARTGRAARRRCGSAPRSALVGLDVDVGGALAHRLREQRVDHADDRRVVVASSRSSIFGSSCISRERSMSGSMAPGRRGRRRARRAARRSKACAQRSATRPARRASRAQLGEPSAAARTRRRRTSRPFSETSSSSRPFGASAGRYGRGGPACRWANGVENRTSATGRHGAGETWRPAAAGWALRDAARTSWAGRLPCEHVGSGRA